MSKKLPDLTAVLLGGYKSPTKYDDEPLRVIASGWNPSGYRGLVITAGRGNYFLAATDVHGVRVYGAPCLQQRRFHDRNEAKRALRDWLNIESLVTENRVLTGPVPRPRTPRPELEGEGFVDQSYDIFVSTPSGTYVVQA